MNETITPVTPKVGMGATGVFGSDCYPYTIVEVKSKTRIVLQEDTAFVGEGHDFFENQVWEFSRNPDTPKIEVSRRKNGRWVEVGVDVDCNGYVIGQRRRYIDPHF